MINNYLTSAIFKKRNSVFIYYKNQISEEVKREYEESLEDFTKRFMSRANFYFYPTHDRFHLFEFNNIVSLIISSNIYDQLLANTDLWDGVIKHYKIEANIIVYTPDKSDMDDNLKLPVIT